VATLVVPTAGLHTVHAWMREDGFVLDRLILTTRTTFVPEGKGPRPSSRFDGTVGLLSQASPPSTALGDGTGGAAGAPLASSTGNGTDGTP
jgi:hypothetical protein